MKSTLQSTEHINKRRRKPPLRSWRALYRSTTGRRECVWRGWARTWPWMSLLTCIRVYTFILLLYYSLLYLLLYCVWRGWALPTPCEHPVHTLCTPVSVDLYTSHLQIHTGHVCKHMCIRSMRPHTHTHTYIYPHIYIYTLIYIYIYIYIDTHTHM